MLYGLIFAGCLSISTAIFVAMRGMIRASNEEIKLLNETISKLHNQLNGCRKIRKAAEDVRKQ